MNPNVNWIETLTLVLLALLVVAPVAKVLIASSLETVRVRSRVRTDRDHVEYAARRRGLSGVDAHRSGRYQA